LNDVGYAPAVESRKTMKSAFTTLVIFLAFAAAVFALFVAALTALAGQRKSSHGGPARLVDWSPAWRRE